MAKKTRRRTRAGEGQKPARTAGVSDAAVLARTGKTWDQWCRLLDKAGAAEMDHKSIAACVRGRFPRIGGWWSQMVTVGYEQARGRREKHQTPAGYQVGASKTVAAPVAAAFAAWDSARTRRRWLGDDAGVTIRKATTDKSLRITWTDGKTHVEVNLYSKGAAKCQIAVQHRKLASAKDAARMKTYWRKRLDALQALLES